MNSLSPPSFFFASRTLLLIRGETSISDSIYVAMILAEINFVSLYFRKKSATPLIYVRAALSYIFRELKCLAVFTAPLTEMKSIGDHSLQRTPSYFSVSSHQRFGEPEARHF